MKPVKEDQSRGHSKVVIVGLWNTFMKQPLTKVVILSNFLAFHFTTHNVHFNAFVPVILCLSFWL